VRKKLLAFTLIAAAASGCDSGSSSPDAGGAGSPGGASTAGTGATVAGASNGTAGSSGNSAVDSGTAGNPNAGTGGSALGGSGGGGGGTPAQGGAGSTLVPASGISFGSFVGAGTVSDLETLLGRKLAINHNYFAWTDSFSAQMTQDFAANRVPLVTWEAWKDSVGASLDEIASGGYDALIHQNAAAVKAFGKPFFLRWGHEMNGNWYPWSGSSNGGATGGAGKYIAAYQHIHDLFVADGATNAQWVFCPNVDSVPGDAWNAWTNYYPGDAYVDWTCADGYNWGTSMTGQTWQSFQTIFSRIYPGLAAKNKPIIIAETASTEMGGDKGAWIAAMLPALKTTFPSVKALVWFDVNKETDWRVNSSPGAQSAFVTMVNDAYFNP